MKHTKGTHMWSTRPLISEVVAAFGPRAALALNIGGSWWNEAERAAWYRNMETLETESAKTGGHASKITTEMAVRYRRTRSLAPLPKVSARNDANSKRRGTAKAVHPRVSVR